MLIIGLAAAAGDVCTTFAAAEGPTNVTGADAPMIESSGVVAARLTEDVYYTHDDNGGDARLYLFYGDGDYYGAQTIAGSTNTDWEDLAGGPCPSTVDAESCLWIADTGDNDEDRADVVLWVVPESTQANVSAVECRLTYPEGKSRDAEALFVSPDGIVRLVDKDPDRAKIFRIDSPVCDGSTQALVEETELVLGEEVTGATMSADGLTVILRGLTRAWMWTGCTLDWSVSPSDIDLGTQPQGEAITLLADGGILTTSESTGEEGLRFWTAACDATETLTCEEEEPPCGCATGGGAAVAMVGGLLALGRRRGSPSR